MVKEVQLDIAAIDAELKSILNFWLDETIDQVHGGFIGQIDFTNTKKSDAPKGSVLNARILWSFSAAYGYTKEPRYKQAADYCYEYFRQNFIDREFGGVYWLLNAQGNPIDTKKQVYAVAFAIYGLTEYFKISNDPSALAEAKTLFHHIEQHAFDTERDGYLEAFSREWHVLDDLRLSNKDENEKKTMNTHLHIMEAYANLYSVWPDPILRKQLRALINLFIDHFIDPETAHLKLFFDENWQSKSTIVSFGHDIEASWLLVEAAEIIAEPLLLKKTQTMAVNMAMGTRKAIDADGGLWYEYEPSKRHWIKEKHWWVQAEAMVGFFNAWELTGTDFFLEKSARAWKFINRSIIDRGNGEWYWGVDEQGNLMKEDKAGIWKCPYHNSRAMIEIGKRLKKQRTANS